jgi:hypothetical protein
MGFFKRQSDMLATARRVMRANAYRKRFRWADASAELCEVGDVPRPWIFETVMEDMHMGILDDVFGRERPSDSSSAGEDAKLASLCPTLHELLTSTPLVAGKRRTVSTLTIVVEDGVFKAGLRDRDRMLSLWVSGEGLAGALDALEEALGRRPVPWRKTPEAYSRNRPKS